MTAEQFRMWIAPISQLAGVLVVAGTIIFWGINLQARVGRLETQMQAVLTSPQNPTASPISPACTSLADRAAQAFAQGDSVGRSAAANIRSLMADLGCLGAKPPQSN
jgi:hypothetical protein